MNRILILVGIYAVWNLIVFLIYGIDKRKAIKNKWRISEKTLIFLAFLMGGIGALLGMVVFHHKTKKAKFIILVPLGILVNALVVYGIYYITFVI